MLKIDNTVIVPDATPTQRRNAKIGLFVACSSLLGVWLFNPDKAVQALTSNMHVTPHVEVQKSATPALPADTLQLK